MDITHSTVRGVGAVHHLTTRGGQRFGVLVEGDTRRLFVFGPDDDDTPAQTITLAQDEADLLADLLHSRPTADRLAALERKIAGVTHQP
jgi:TrkA domain protein